MVVQAHAREPLLAAPEYRPGAAPLGLERHAEGRVHPREVKGRVLVGQLSLVVEEDHSRGVGDAHEDWDSARFARSEDGEEDGAP